MNKLNQDELLEEIADLNEQVQKRVIHGDSSYNRLFYESKNLNNYDVFISYSSCRRNVSLSPRRGTLFCVCALQPRYQALHSLFNRFEHSCCKVVVNSIGINGMKQSDFYEG
mgnify:CR=1 FL=1